MVEKRLGLTRVCFFQGPIGHRKRRPTCLGTNLEPDPVIVECGVPLSRIDYVERKDYGMLEELWSEWAPGLIQAMSSMLHRSFAMTRQETSVGGELRKIDPGFLHHLQQNHMPYRHDCVTCLKGSARRKQHRRVLTPQSWCLSVDTAGPFVKGRDEHTTKARYLIVGVLSVPILALNGKEVDVPCDADEGPPVPEGGAIDDAEWLSDGMGVSDEPEPGLSAREVADARESWNEWDRLVKSSREDWLGEAQSEKLPKVEIVDFVYVEAIERKTHGEVLTAIGRMHARAKAEGFDVRRLHSDRGREYNNKSLRDWCARHSVHKTLAVAEEHQGNGRAEGAIMRVKNLTRTILEESAGEKLDWPLAAKLAAHELKNTARRRLKIEVHQSLPFNTRVQVISRSWKRDTWESRTTTALVKCPSADMSRGWVVATEDGKLLTTGKLFPSVDQGKVSFSSTGSAVDLDAPDYRIKGKTSMKQLQVPEGLSSLHRVDQLAKELFEKAQYRPRDLAELAVEISKLRQHSSRMVKEVTGETLEYLPMCEPARGSDGEGDCVRRAPNLLPKASCDGEELIQLECDSFSLDAGGDKPYWESLEALERQGSELRRLEGGLLGSACSVVLKSMSVIEEIGLAEGDVSEQVETTGARPEEQEEPPLQTKIIGADQVRREPEKWIPSMIEEYQSLVSKTGAVQELSDSQYKQLLDDPGVTLEIIPGKLVYVHKTSGYELQKTSEGIRLHQESYVRDLLEQTEESIVGEERAPAVKMGSFDDVVDESDKRELTKRSQTLIGQLLWLAGRLQMVAMESGIN
ncbi:unnamed protein product [Symbiodinium microadriaticum]|nr:unnamed protein product [Symbiodinium sp. KB8]CAE7656724.1 unnamed protein product [Symbiodinium microadriaticum]